MLIFVKPGMRVQLVEMDLVRILLNEEIDACHAGTINGLVGAHGILTNLCSHIPQAVAQG